MLLLVKKLQKSILLLWRKLGGCLCDNWKPSFLPLLIFDWRTFSMQVTAWWWRKSEKNQVSTNQNSRNRWCLIVRRTICWWRWEYIYSCLSLQYWNQIFLAFGFVLYYSRTMFYMHHASKKLGIRYYFWVFLLRYYFLIFLLGLNYCLLPDLNVKFHPGVTKWIFVLFILNNCNQSKL